MFFIIIFFLYIYIYFVSAGPTLWWASFISRSLEGPYIGMVGGVRCGEVAAAFIWAARVHARSHARTRSHAHVGLIKLRGRTMRAAFVDSLRCRLPLSCSLSPPSLCTIFLRRVYLSLPGSDSSAPLPRCCSALLSMQFLYCFHKPFFIAKQRFGNIEVPSCIELGWIGFSFFSSLHLTASGWVLLGKNVLKNSSLWL